MYTIEGIRVILLPLLINNEVVMAGLQCPPVNCPAKHKAKKYTKD